MHYVHVNKHLAPPTFHLYKDTQIYFSVPVSGGSRNLKEHFCYISPFVYSKCSLSVSQFQSLPSNPCAGLIEAPTDDGLLKPFSDIIGPTRTRQP